MQHDPLPTLPALAASALSTVPGRLAMAVFVLLSLVDLATLAWDPNHYVLLKRGMSHDMAEIRKFAMLDSSQQ